MQRIERETIVPASLNEVWEFFSTPINLNALTPPDLSFEILTDLTDVQMFAGMVIEYKVRPIANIPMKWVTEITQCAPGRMFVDEQRFGPYRFWHHLHTFESIDADRVRMKDVVHYDVGMGPIGKLADKLYVGKRLEAIFDFRKAAIPDLFPTSR